MILINKYLLRFDDINDRVPYNGPGFNKKLRMKNMASGLNNLQYKIWKGKYK